MISAKVAYTVIFITLAGVVGFVLMGGIMGKTPVHLEGSIIINKPVEEVFRVIVDPANIGKISQNIAEVQMLTSGGLEQGASFQRILYSHSIRNFQVVTVQEFELNKTFVTKTSLVGFDVIYRYQFAPTPEGGTQLWVTKDGSGPIFFLKPLLIHLLTQPEHDGDHLTRIKNLIEAAGVRGGT